MWVKEPYSQRSLKRNGSVPDECELEDVDRNHTMTTIIVAQRKRVGLITRRTVDRNNPMISYFIFLIVKKMKYL